MVKKITTHEVDALSRIITQYKGDRGLERMIKSGAVQIQELENAAFPLFSRLSIDSMIGAQLDLIGDIVGQDRQGQDDITYRVFLKAKIGINTSSGTIEDVLSVWKILLPDATLELTEMFPAEVSLVTDAILTDAQKDFLKDFDDILSAGVRLSSVINYDPENAFAFGEIHDEVLDSGEILPYDSIDTYGFDFDGATFVSVYNNPSINWINSEYSFTAKVTDTGIVQTIWREDTTTDKIIIQVNTSGQLVVQTRNGSNYDNDESIVGVVPFGEVFECKLVCDLLNENGFDYVRTIGYINGENATFNQVLLTNTTYQLNDYNTTGIARGQFGTPKLSAVISDFIIISDGEKVFEETFDNITLGTINTGGTEQYAITGTTTTPDANEGEQYILTTSPLSQDDELYTCINGEWIQTSVSLGYEVSSLNDGLIYKYINNGTYNVFEEHEENENTGGFGDVNDLSVGGELATIL